MTKSGGASVTTIGSKSLKKEKAKEIVEERSSIPPGKSRFSRTYQTEEGSSKVQQSEELLTEADFCQRLLVDGYVQSYVDFYHLTHRSDPHAPEGRINNKIETPPDDMKYIRDNLVKAEVSRRQGNTTGVYNAFNNLAEFYKRNMDWRTAIYFHEKCLEVAQLTQDLRAEMTANHSLGTVYQRMGEWEIAQRFHERHEEIAYSVDILEEAGKANIELHNVYLVLAQRKENASDIDGALEVYHKCLESSKKCWDKAAEGEANGKIGQVLLRRGDAAASLPYLRNHSQIAADLGDAEGRCRACSALAWALDSLGDDESALTELTLVHSISEQAGDTYLQAQACRSLGTLYSKVGKLEQAVDALQKHFDLFKILAHRATVGSTAALKKGKKTEKATNEPIIKAEDLDLARVYVGISRGNLLMGAYVMAIDCRLSALLDWKLGRTDLPPIL
mmetsp:Transcript_14803/g.14907  ORF Transcript_14803/g.14907 Transcript_14803/m.14907 type:complete len:447 (+) Transcript_14803:234-1574(+)|eukprot:CAMPEP_0182437912 /NCGR_PEP_ID=MMETSP1167-20130531/85363_1 /TAXON_ID=2988 /ORGANISM="Mallomonas Sp, Strain CCMP3275" /LENGTH=446 /DNA_ID=CAMNT_0024630999 /DNA_START=211 /DNA_END=1551 /DNA_ORIENTATION=-